MCYFLNIQIRWAWKSHLIEVEHISYHSRELISKKRRKGSWLTIEKNINENIVFVQEPKSKLFSGRWVNFFGKKNQPESQLCGLFQFILILTVMSYDAFSFFECRFNRDMTVNLYLIAWKIHQKVFERLIKFLIWL